MPSDPLTTSLELGFRRPVPNHSAKVATIFVSSSRSHFPTFPTPPLPAGISQAPDQLVSQEFKRFIACRILGTDPQASERATEIDDIHRFWGLHDLKSSMTVPAECKTFLSAPSGDNGIERSDCN